MAYAPYKIDIFFYIERVQEEGSQKIIKRCIMDGPSCWSYNICGNIWDIGNMISPIHFYNNYTINDYVQMKRTELKYFGKNVANS